MDYQELITSYENKSLDITNLKKKLEIARPLKGREKFRALDMIAQRSSLITDISNVLIISEKPEKIENFEADINNVLLDYFKILVQSIKNAKGWKFMNLIPSDYSVERFKCFYKKEQLKILLDLNKKYVDFLEYQSVADIRDCLRNGSDLNDETIRKLEFLRLMFNAFKNQEIKNEFFCFDKKFLMALIEFKKNKTLRLEDFIKTKRKNIVQEYEKFLKFFTNEDFRDIAENLLQTSKALKTSINNVVEAFSELSESESEISYLKSELKEIKKLEKKYLKMQALKPGYEETKEKAETKLDPKVLDLIQINSKAIQNKKEEKPKVKLEKVLKEDNKEEAPNVKQEIKEEQLTVNNVVRRKEQVNPIIFSWLEREDMTFARRIGVKKVTEFFEKIKLIEEKTRIRVSLYIVTNVGKELALKRMQDIQKRAAAYGLPRLVEGVLGGYSSFRIDATGKVTDIAVMSDLNKEKILNLLNITKGSALQRELVDKTESSYIRYLVSNGNDSSIDKRYLNLLISNLLRDERVRRQPLKYLPFIEGKYAGIDVLLESQLKGISQLPDYYKAKYNIAPGKTMNARIDNIDAFING